MSDGNNAQAQTTDAGVQSQGSAPDTNVAKTNEVSKVDTNPNPKGGAPKGLLKEVFRLRGAKRSQADEIASQADEIASMRAELESFKSKGAGNGGNQKVDPLEDPDAYRAALKAEAAEAAKAQFNELLTQHNVNTSAVREEQWLRTRSHVVDDAKAGDEIAEIIASNYSHLVKIDPRAAARSAYSDWCEMKGVSPDLSNSPSLKPPTHAKTSAAGAGASNADKTYTPQEVKAAQVALKDNPKALAAYNADVMKAAKEGRYKGTAYIIR
jgi:hypothetical protein